MRFHITNVAIKKLNKTEILNYPFKKYIFFIFIAINTYETILFMSLIG